MCQVTRFRIRYFRLHLQKTRKGSFLSLRLLRKGSSRYTVYTHYTQAVHVLRSADQTEIRAGRGEHGQGMARDTSTTQQRILETSCDNCDNCDNIQRQNRTNIFWAVAHGLTVKFFCVLSCIVGVSFGN